MKFFTIFALLLGIFSFRVSAQSKFGFALYNADRFYDTIPSPFYDDSDYTPRGRMRWNSERYQRKAAQTAALLDSMAMPVVALCGVENEQVVRDIVSRCRTEYSYIHRTCNSFDGMDFALLYFGELLYPVRVGSDPRSLVVEAEIGGSRYAFILCRRPRNLEQTIDELFDKNPDIHIVVAGDWREGDLDGIALADITAPLVNAGRGNAFYGNRWQMFDRIAVDGSLEAQCEVYIRRWLLDRNARPAATYDGTRYRGGCGRRLPVWATIDIAR